MSNYDRFPHINCSDARVTRGYDNIISELQDRITTDARFVLIAETYPGVRDEEILPQLKQLNPSLVIETKDLYLSDEAMTEKMMPWLTDDRVFGHMYSGTVETFLDNEIVQAAKKAFEDASGLILVYGMGASLFGTGDLCVLFDMARWEIQMRYRAGMGNYNCSNTDDDILRKFKRGYFVEWRMADLLKIRILDSIDYLIDTNKADDPKMITGDQFRNGLKQAVNQPFRLVPYFDPGVWGGQWMKEHCNLDPSAKNYAWSFDGVPEENSLYLRFGDTDVEIPAMDLTLYCPKELLGAKNYARFGAEFPIRFDFLDTMGGQNLSLQVHPLTEYIHRTFGMAYTQDESYYLLDAGEDACVYLGVKTGTKPEDMLGALKEAQETGTFDAERYVNKFPAKKHDHFLIPAGTIHCSGTNAMVLEISATPYIFTFKLWDWGRLGLDGKPRPINIEHGSHVIQWDRTTDWVKEHLVNPTKMIHTCDAYDIEHTGLHELEFIETRRYTVRESAEIDLCESVSMCNLVEGSAARIESPDNQFEPYEVHYAETFILPANIGRVRIVPVEGTVKVMRAFVRGSLCCQ
ncbi:MAG: class I mannose-6-phosphate isomerase [Solobacterium sp.]|nr:class I mannose-6-phosphate isomerase [Solobacterium sp.]